jgi:hypothetical protein
LKIDQLVEIKQENKEEHKKIKKIIELFKNETNENDAVFILETHFYSFKENILSKLQQLSYQFSENGVSINSYVLSINVLPSSMMLEDQPSDRYFAIDNDCKNDSDNKNLIKFIKELEQNYVLDVLMESFSEEDIIKEGSSDSKNCQNENLKDIPDALTIIKILNQLQEKNLRELKMLLDIENENVIGALKQLFLANSKI